MIPVSTFIFLYDDSVTLLLTCAFVT